MVLKNPKLEGDKLTFTVPDLEGDIAGADGGAALFIDIIGRPFTPMPFAASHGVRHSGRDVCRRRGAAAYGARPRMLRLRRAISVRAARVRLLPLSACY